MVTRAVSQADSLATALGGLGAEVNVVPLIDIEEPSDGGRALNAAVAQLAVGHYQWVVITSVNAANRFITAAGPGISPAGALMCAVGPGTAAVLEAGGYPVDLMPTRHIAEGIVEVFPDPPPGGGRVLVPRAAVGRNVLPDGLEQQGWSVDAVEAYRTVPACVDDTARSAVEGADAVVFMSSSAVNGFAEAFGSAAAPPLVVCIGPATADTARHRGLSGLVVADPHTTDGVVAALAAAWGAPDTS